MSNKSSKPDSEHYPALEGTWGLSGIETLITLTRLYKDPDDLRNLAPPSGSSGTYKVSFVLSRPDYALVAENQISFADDISGDSHIFIGSPDELRVEIEAKLPDGDLTLYGYPNQKGFLGKVEIEELAASGFGNANLKAYNALSIVLSRLALVADVPLHIYRMTTVELATRNLMSSLTLPFVQKPPQLFSGYEKDKALAKFASLYREALNTKSPNYQYLCFYKIIEGIRRLRESRTTRENQEAIDRGEKPPVRPREFIPKTPDEQSAFLNAIFGVQKWSDMALAACFPSEVAGRKLNDVIRTSGVLDSVRNRIAHSVLREDTRDTLNIDDASHMAEVAKWLPLCKCISRYLLKEEYPQVFKS